MSKITNGLLRKFNKKKGMIEWVDRILKFVNLDLFNVPKVQNGTKNISDIHVSPKVQSKSKF